VYCIIEASEPLGFGSVGIGAEPTDVYTVHYRNLAAVVSDAPIEVLDSTRENVLAHERVNETVMREHTVIPMSFGKKGPTYFARMQYGRLVDAALHARSEQYVAAVLQELRDVSVASRINKPIGDKMIMNAAFLISRDQEQAFDTKVKSIAARFDKLTFKYTGPWPPYNFVNIRLKLERA
jgi:hypothetical protein